MKRTIVNPIIKDKLTFLQTSEESDGKITEAEITLMPGGGNPLHYHKTFSETFTAIDGELGLKLGNKESKILKAGESYTVEPMSLHSFFNPTNREIKFNVKIMPGHSGFENSLRIIYGLAGDGLTDKNTVPKSIKHSAIILCMSDMNLPGFFTLMFPLLKLLAKRAKASGEEQKLIDKYCIQQTYTELKALAITAATRNWWFSASYDSFVVNQTFILHMNIYSKNRQLLVAAKRWLKL